MLRKLAKAGVAAGIHNFGVDRVIGVGRRLQNLPLVLSYHRVVENFARSAEHSIPPMLVSTATFEAQLDWIGRRYDFVSVDELALAMQEGRTFRKPIATVTFDDGYGDSYYHAFPVLKRKGIPMTVFVVTDLVGSNDLQGHDELHLLLTLGLRQWPRPLQQIGELCDRAGIEPVIRAQICSPELSPFGRTRMCLELLQHTQICALTALLRAHADVDTNAMYEFHALTWEMIRHMDANGVTIGSHTKSHKLLVNESWDSLLEQLKDSKVQLERQLGHKVDHFAYPDGRFNTDALKGVDAAGYRYAYTTCMHRDKQYPLLTIPRRVLWENTCVNGFGKFSPSILSCQLNGIFDPAAKCQQTHWAA